MLSNIIILTQSRNLIVEPSRQIYIKYFIEDGKYHILTNFINGDYDDLAGYKRINKAEQVLLFILESIAKHKTTFVMPIDD